MLIHDGGVGLKAMGLAFAMTLGSGACASALAGAILVSPRPGPVEPYRFFGGRTVTVPLVVHAFEPGGITLRAQLVQLTADLAVPIGAEVDVFLPRDSARRRVEAELSTPLPAVTRETGFELWIRSRPDGQAVWDMAGQIPLRVYPADLLAPVRRWASAHPLRVKDEHGSLLALLRREGIPVVEVTGAPDPRPGRIVTLYAGPRVTGERAKVLIREGEAVVLFTESGGPDMAPTPPTFGQPRRSRGCPRPCDSFTGSERQTSGARVVIERAGGSTAVTVDMPLLDRLATDPLAQRILLELLQFVLEDRPSTGGDIR